MYVVANTVRCMVVKKTLRTERYRAPSFHGTQCTSLYLNARIAPRVLFLSKCYKNGPHAGFLLYMADVAADTQDVDKLRQAMRDSKGPGNFRKLFMYAGRTARRTASRFCPLYRALLTQICAMAEGACALAGPGEEVGVRFDGFWRTLNGFSRAWCDGGNVDFCALTGLYCRPKAYAHSILARGVAGGVAVYSGYNNRCFSPVPPRVLICMIS